MRDMTPRGRWVAALAGLLLALPPAATSSASADPVAAVRDGRGAWQVRTVDEGRWVVTWRSPERLPVTSDRPTVTGPAGWQVGIATLDRDDRTVRALVGAPERPDPARLAVVLSGVRLDRPERRAVRRASAASAPLDLPGTRTLTEDPGTPGPYAVVTSDYTLAPVPLPGLPAPVEMVGHVVEPAPTEATGPRPFVLLLHGRHSTCYVPGRPRAWGPGWPCSGRFREVPSQLGYDYLQRVLASQGYATVSIRANGVNAQDGGLRDGGADARARLVRAHLDHWVDLAAAHQVDLGHVVLVGHSRGGEGVDRASIRTPLSAPYRIVGQVLVAPTDFGEQAAAYVPTVTLLPACDGDVSDLQGQGYTDVARDLAPGDTSLHGSVLLMGANHNYFNTEWTPGLAAAPAVDDWQGAAGAECGGSDAQRLSAAAQRAVATAYVAGAVRLFASGDQALLPLFDGTRARVASQGAAQTLSHAVGGGRDVVALGNGAIAGPAAGAAVRACRGTVDPIAPSSCGHGIYVPMPTPHWRASGLGPVRRFLEVRWSAVGQAGGLSLVRPLDLTGRRLELRVLSDPAYAASVQVRVTDAAGASATLAPVGGGGLPRLGRQEQARRLWGQAVVVDAASLAAAPVDLAGIARVELVAHSDRGRVWIADVAAAGDALPAVPAVRLPTVDVGSLRIAEGDGGRRVVAVPFAVHGTVSAPARLLVVTAGQRPGDLRRFAVDLAPGQTGGSVPLEVEGDRRADYPTLTTQVVAWGSRNVMTDGYLGALTVRDDDPRPRIVAVPVETRVQEGRAIRLRVRLDRRVDYDVAVAARVVRGPGTPVQVGDLDRDWVGVHVGIAARPTAPVWRTRTTLYADLRPGRRTVDLVVPTGTDRVVEGPETLTLRLDVDGHRLRRTVTLVDAG